MHRRRIFILVYIAVAFGASRGSATQTILGISGISRYTTTTGIWNVYGGLVGKPPSSPNGLPFDSCAGMTMTDADLPNGGCNNARVYPELMITFTVTSDEANGTPIILPPTTTTGGPIASGVMTSKGLAGTVQVLWSTLCPQLSAVSGTADISCAGVLSGTGWKVGISTDGTTLAASAPTVNFYAVNTIASQNTLGSYLADTCDNALTTDGACDFSLYPGDSKAWIDTFRVPAAFPTAIGAIQYFAIRFYYTQGAYTNLRPDSPHTDVTFTGAQSTGDFALSAPYIDGLTNQTVNAAANYYYFMIASLDQAGNVGFFSDINQTGYDVPHKVLPQPASGLLEKQFNCFIATAAYGSPFQAKVKTFREFRDRYLMTTHWGQNLVAWYYRTSPRYANWIAQSESLRASARVLLWPLWAYSALALRWGIALASLVSLGLLLGLTLLFRMRARRLGFRGRR